MTYTRLRLGRLEGEPQALFRHRRRRVDFLPRSPRSSAFSPQALRIPPLFTPHVLTCVLHALTLRGEAALEVPLCLQYAVGAKLERRALS